jgi:formamidopyrimidine-DNA glycosylase
MPELPEVETVRRGLEPALAGRQLVRVEVNRADLRVPFPERFGARLTGRWVTRLDRRAKYLLWHLDDHMVVVIHLGMSGRMLIDSSLQGQFHHQHAIKAEKHDHVVFHTDRGTRIVFNDHRRFGLMNLISGNALDQDPMFSMLGPEPLGPDFTAGHLARAFAKKRAPIKAALLDQHVVAGLGNIYVCEALHGAKIDPMRLALSLSQPELRRLVEEIKQVLIAAIAAGGSSLRDYKQASGELGYFQHAFKVYDQAGKSCPRPRCRGTITRLVQSNRSTFMCPTCQK